MNEYKHGDRVVTPKGLGRFIHYFGKQHAYVRLDADVARPTAFRRGDVKPWVGTPLLTEDGHGDVLYTGDLDAGKALARVDRWAREKPGDNGGYVVELHDSPALDDMAEWGAGETLDEAWRYALGATFGPLDSEYDDAALRRALDAVREKAGATASTGPDMGEIPRAMAEGRTLHADEFMVEQEADATRSTTYTVTVTVANTRGEVSLQWYRGASLPEAMAAMAQAAVQDVADTDMPESVRTYLRSVTLSFEEN